MTQLCMFCNLGVRVCFLSLFQWKVYATWNSNDAVSLHILITSFSHEIGSGTY